MRFSPPRALISRPLLPLLRAHWARHTVGYRRLGDCLLYGGVIAVLAIATYLLTVAR